MHFCGGECFRNEALLEGSILAGSSGLVESSCSHDAGDRDFRGFHKACGFDDPFVCEYAGRAPDHFGVDLPDLPVRAMGAVVTGVTTVVAVAFAVFMTIIDLLICFIQAYVFMMLSTIFISLARAKETRFPINRE